MMQCLFPLNAQSFRNKYVEVSLYVEELKHNFDVLLFAETWYMVRDVIQLDRYNCEALFRPSKGGGGLALYITDGISYLVITK